MGVYNEFISNCKRRSGETWRTRLGIDSGVFQSLPAAIETGPALDPAASEYRKTSDYCTPRAEGAWSLSGSGTDEESSCERRVDGDRLSKSCEKTAQG